MRLCQYPCVHHSHPWKELYATRMAKLHDKNRPAAERQFKKKHEFVCMHCECTKGFESESMLLNHIELRHGPNRQKPPVPTARPAKVDPTTGLILQRVGNTYPCPVQGCGKTFNKAIELKYHFDGVHKQSRAFPCDWPNCHKSFVSPAQLNLHRCKHTGAPRPHMCKHPGCNKTFNTPSQVVKHAQMHLDKSERTWLPCTVPGCTQTYATQSAIKKHIATAHDPAQLRFRCANRELLAAVMPIGGAAREQVAACPAAFFTKATWVEHLKAKHGLEPTHPQLMEVVRIMRGLPQLPQVAPVNVNLMPPQFLAAMQMQQAAAAGAAAAAGQGGSTQNRAANAVALAMQAAAAAGGPPGAPPLFAGSLPSLPSLPSLLPFPVNAAGGASASLPLTAPVVGTPPAAATAPAPAAAAAASSPSASATGGIAAPVLPAIPAAGSQPPAAASS